MATIVQSDVVTKATALGQLTDASTIARLDIIAEMLIEKVANYIGYDVPDTLTNVIAEMVVTEISHYSNLQETYGGLTGADKKITRGDFTAEYDTSGITNKVDILHSYEWILKKYKKLRSL